MLAVAWAVGPALPVLLRGELIGHPFTDLYPSVWGLWWFAGQQPGLPSFATHLAAPEGMPFYYSSPLHGWAVWPLLGVVSLPAAWNLTVLAARLATVLVAYGAGRAWGLREPGALVAAAIYGASPFFQGYAVEGIVEGLDGWTLALWLLALGRRRWGLGAVAFALTVISSWYLGAVACVLAALLGRRAWVTAALGLVLSAPLLALFFGAFPEGQPLDPAVRAAMGAQLAVGRPGILPGLQPFAMTTWVGGIAPLLALWGLRDSDLARRAAIVLGTCALLSLGLGPIYDLAPFSSLRFPYRFHAGTLAALALLAGLGADRLRVGAWLAPVLVLEGLLLSPIEPVLPGAPGEVPALYDDLQGEVLLDVPGPVAMPPGEINRSRARARSFLYAQTAHGMGTPWAPDFNSVGAVGEELGLAGVRALDPLVGADPPLALDLPQSIDHVVVHVRELRGAADTAHRLLLAEGWVRTGDDGERWRYARSP